jgi:hypothetical protein
LYDKRSEGPGHPPCYIVESQDVVNQFSFWPRYDEFVERPPGMPNPEDQSYSEEGGVNLFTGRSALYIQDAGRKRIPHNLQAGFSWVDRVARIEVRRFGRVIRVWDIYLCLRYRTLPL